MRALAVAAGGAVGSLLRWGIGLLVAPVAGGLPVATLVANVAAGLLPALANVIVNVATCLVAVWAGGRIAGMVA